MQNMTLEEVNKALESALSQEDELLINNAPQEQLDGIEERIQELSQRRRELEAVADETAKIKATWKYL
jgi:hypothetical protein